MGRAAQKCRRHAADRRIGGRLFGRLGHVAAPVDQLVRRSVRHGDLDFVEASVVSLICGNIGKGVIVSAILDCRCDGLLDTVGVVVGVAARLFSDLLHCGVFRCSLLEELGTALGVARGVGGSAEAARASGAAP